MDRVGRWLNMDLYELAREDGLLGTMLPSDEQLAEQFGTFSPWARQAAWLVNEFAWERLNGEVDAQAPTTPRGGGGHPVQPILYFGGAQRMKKTMMRRAAAMVLGLTMLATSAGALTAEQAGELLQEYYYGDLPPRCWSRTRWRRCSLCWTTPAPCT